MRPRRREHQRRRAEGALAVALSAVRLWESRAMLQKSRRLQEPPRYSAALAYLYNR